MGLAVQSQVIIMYDLCERIVSHYLFPALRVVSLSCFVLQCLAKKHLFIYFFLFLLLLLLTF